MSRNTSVSLGEPFTKYLDSVIQTGSYSSASEVIRDALRMKMQYDERMETLRGAIQAGIDSGPPRRIDPEKKLQELKQRAQRTKGLNVQAVGQHNDA